MNFKNFHYNPNSGQLTYRETGETITLRQKLNLLLAYLIEHRDRIVPKDELLNTLWDHGDFRESSLTQSIGELRRALGDSAQEAKYIKTYQQRGYQWQCEITEVEQAINNENATDRTAFTSAYIRRSPIQRYAIPCFLVLVSCALLCGFILWPKFEPNRKPPQTARQPPIPSIMVLPFVNESGDPSHDWVALGLSDMIAVEMQRSGWAKITPPALANMQLLNAELSWPTLPVHIRSLIKETHHDLALIASFRLYNKQQVLDFQLISNTGQIQQGAITYPMLPEQTQAIAKQILHLARPEKTYTPAAPTHPDPKQSLGWQAIVEGMSALQTSGPRSAMDYFQAAKLLIKDEPWVLAYLAQTEIYSGKWSNALTHLQRAEHYPTQDISLKAFVAYLQAELAFREGRRADQNRFLEKAIEFASRIHNVQVLADSYRLAARSAWIDMQWEENKRWTEKANALYPRGSDLRIEAEKLFYLGNPIAVGPEKDPQQNLLLSRERIQTALNFYQQLGNEPAIAASYFALAQNYTLPLAERNAALDKAIQKFTQLQLPYELSEVYLYAAFHYLQLHKGERSLAYIAEAEKRIQPYSQHALSEALTFYRAFSKLDIGLDQSFRGLHGQDKVMLQQAINEFEFLAEHANNPYNQANSMVMLGWAYSDLNHYPEAIHYLQNAMHLYRHHNMPTTYSYAVYSLMYIYLKQGEYHKVIELGKEPIHTARQLVYLSRAYYETQQTGYAINTLLKLKDYPGFWKPTHQRRLEYYQAAINHQPNPLSLFDEEPAHSEYCEQGWTIEEHPPTYH